MKNIVARPRVYVAAGSESLISSSGLSLLAQTASVNGLSEALSAGLSRWRKPTAIHDPGKVVLDLVLAIAAGGDCLADVSLVRAQPELFGQVASDPTISRLIDRDPFDDADSVVVDLDATLIGAHSEKELASPNYKRGFGFHPMMAFVDHGTGGTGEPLAAKLRTGRATANSADDQIEVLDQALAQLPEDARSRVLVRGDSGAGVREFVHHIHGLGLQYSVGVYGRQPILDALAALPRQAWRKALDTNGERREGALVAELTRWLPNTFAGWPPGMRVIARKERPHPGAQLRITDENGWRITMFATNTSDHPTRQRTKNTTIHF